MITASQLVVWVIIGVMAGALVGLTVRRGQRGFGVVINLAIGLAGALIGGGLFSLFNVNLGLGEIAVSVEDVIAAFLGSLLLLLVIAVLRFRRRRKSPPGDSSEPAA